MVLPQQHICIVFPYSFYLRSVLLNILPTSVVYFYRADLMKCDQKSWTCHSDPNARQSTREDRFLCEQLVIPDFHQHSLHTFTSYTLPPRNNIPSTAMADPRIRQIKIKTGIVKRYVSFLVVKPLQLFEQVCKATDNGRQLVSLAERNAAWHQTRPSTGRY